MTFNYFVKFKCLESRKQLWIRIKNYTTHKPWHATKPVMDECGPFNLTENKNEILNLVVGDLRNHFLANEKSESGNKTYFLDLPRPIDKGKFLGLEIKKKSVHVSCVVLNGRDLDERSIKYENDEEITGGSRKKLALAVTKSLEKFIKENKDKMDVQGKLPMGVSLALGSNVSPPTQHSYALAQSELTRKLKKCISDAPISKMKNIDVKAIIQDCTGTMMAGHWMDEKIKSGIILGDEAKTCYLSSTMEESQMTVRNTPLNDFGDNGEIEYLRTQHDITLDLQSQNPGKQRFEKLMSNRDLGELARIVLLKMAMDGFLFGGRVSAPLMTSGSIPTSHLVEIEKDIWGSQDKCRRVLQQKFHVEPSRQDCVDTRYIVEALTRRSAHLAAAVIAALDGKGAAVDGNLVLNLPHFLNTMTFKANELLGKEVILVHIPRSSVIGAALMAARLSAIENSV